MFTKDKINLNKAIYVCLTVSSMLVTADGYGIDPSENRINACKKRLASYLEDDKPAKKQKKNACIFENMDKMCIDFKKQIKRDIKYFIYIINSAYNDIDFSFSNLSLMEDFEEIVQTMRYALEDKCEEFKNLVEEEIINPINIQLTKFNNSYQKEEAMKYLIKTLREISDTLENLYSNVKKEIEREVIRPINDLMECDDECKCIIF